MAIMLQNRLQILGVFAVVPLTGHVDRNLMPRKYDRLKEVVPLTGHVDRN